MKVRLTKHWPFHLRLTLPCIGTPPVVQLGATKGDAAGREWQITVCLG